MPSLKGGKPRIAMLGHKRIPSREGGVEIVVGELAARMCDKGYSVTCYNRKGHHVSGASFDESAKNNYKGVKLKTVLTIDKKGLAAMTASFSAAICAAFGRYDVVHFHAEGPCAMIWLPKMLGKRCIATIHGLDHQRAKWGRFASWYIRFGEKCAVKYADEIIVLSQNVKNYFAEKYGRETVYIPNGISKSEKVGANEIAKKLTLNGNDYILYLGRLVPEKFVDGLIKAFCSINTDKKLVIAGGVSDSAEYAAQLKELANDNDKVVFTDFVQGKLLNELYSNAYLYVLPSNLEGMPLSLLEAMSFGNCCLVSDIPECSEVIGDCGFTFKQGNVDDLKEKLQQLCDDSFSVKKFKEQSSDYICNRYNWDEVTKETLKLYGVTDL